MSSTDKKYRIYRYYEGLCSSANIVKELAKVLSLGVRSNEYKDASGKVLVAPTVLQDKNWDIIYPAVDTTTLSIDESSKLSASMYRSKIMNQIDQITDTVILKTTTTPIDNSDSEDDISIDNDINKTSLTMYLEIYKPTYVANPEDYPLDCEREGIIPKLITKDIYEKAYSDSVRYEETLTINDSERDNCPTEDEIASGSVSNTTTYYTKSLSATPKAQITVEDFTESKSGIATFGTYAECNVYVSKIISNYMGSASIDGFYMPTISDTSTDQLTYTKVMITGVKSNDTDLYKKIIETLNISDSEYQRISSIAFMATKISDTEYTISMESNVTIKQYTIPEGVYYKIGQHLASNKRFGAETTVLTTVVPEYLINGLYVPLSKDYWDYDTTDSANRTIYFKKTVKGNTLDDGNIVLKYDIGKEEDEVISDRDHMLNNHYLLMRLFDDLNDDKTGPSETTYEDNGDIKVQKAHVSDWAKLSWYKDFEEIYKDDIDADISTTSITDGTLFVPLRTVGLSSESKIHYWINTNNDRFSLVVMGNAALDYSRDRHMIGACYCGKVDSFDNSINDVSGNFALFTSSSTEPCKTTLTYTKEVVNVECSGSPVTSSGDGYVLSTAFSEYTKTISNKGVDFAIDCIDGTVEYYIDLPEDKYYDTSYIPRFFILDTEGNVLTNQDFTSFKTVIKVVYSEDLSSMTITLDQAYDEGYKLYIAAAYYTNKPVLTSGVTRDYYGNIESVEKTDTYGLNTSDGVTSVMMYHTRTKTYYQKHQLMFTTTEEYMSKVLYGKSLYTGEYYADRIKVTHGNDGPRGMLNDMIVIDSASLVPFDELVINKDFEKDPNDYEETYIYFPITAPFSPLSDGPNARYGFAIKEKEVEPSWTDESIIAALAAQELELIAENTWWGIDEDIYPIRETSNGCTVLYSVVDDSESDEKTPWYSTEDNYIAYTPVDLCLLGAEYRGDPSVILANTVIAETEVTSDTASTYTSGNEFYCTVHYAGTHTLATDADSIYYGVFDEVPSNVYDNDTIAIVVEPENKGTAESNYVYPIKEYLYNGIIESTKVADSQDIKLKDAKPDRYLVFFDVDTSDATKKKIKGYSSIQLTKSLIKYPSTVQITVASGLATVNMELSQLVAYNDSLVVKFTPNTGYTLNKVTLSDSTGTVKSTYTYTSGDSAWTLSNNTYTLTIDNVVEDGMVSIYIDSPTGSNS